MSIKAEFNDEAVRDLDSINLDEHVVPSVVSGPQNGEFTENPDEEAPVPEQECKPEVDDIAAAALADFDAEDSDENEQDETVNVIIKPTTTRVPGLYKSSTSYSTKLQSGGTQLASKQSKTGIDLDDVGDIQGKPVVEFNLNFMPEEDKPWKQPGADVTDYFNYGFTEETWLRYCERQRVMRLEYANSTIKPLSNSNALAMSGMMGRHKPSAPKPPSRIETIASTTTENTTSVPMPFNGSMQQVVNLPLNMVPNMSVPPPVLPRPGMPWQIPHEALMNPGLTITGDLSGRPSERPESPGSDYSDSYERRRRERRMEELRRLSRKRSRSRSNERVSSRSRRQDDRDYDRSHRSSRHGERSRRHDEDSSRHRRHREHDRDSRRDERREDRDSRRSKEFISSESKYRDRSPHSRSYEANPEPPTKKEPS